MKQILTQKGEIYMRLNGEEYSKRLEGYSTSTIKLISLADSGSKELALKASEITTDSTLSEAQVRSKLIQLLNSTSTKTKIL